MNNRKRKKSRLAYNYIMGLHVYKDNIIILYGGCNTTCSFIMKKKGGTAVVINFIEVCEEVF